MIHPLPNLTRAQLQPLIAASEAEGYAFVSRLWDERDTFAAPGACLLGGFADGRLVAVGGVHRDPYLNMPGIGRVRHVYVLPDARRRGMGAALVRALIDCGDFHTYTLRTVTDHGRAFYEALGFQTTPRFPDATHWLDKAPV